MSYEAVGRRYARAIFELAKESGQLAAASDQIGAFASAYEASPELRGVLDNPLVDMKEQMAILEEIASRLGASDLVKSSLKLLAGKRRIAAIPDIARSLSRLADDDAKVLRAEVTSAGPLSQEYLQKLGAEIERATGRKVKLSHREDKSLLGGVVTKIGDRVIDGSLKARLNALRDQLLRT